MRLELKHLHSPDLPHWEQSNSQTSEIESIFVQALIGPQNAPGEESFSFTLCKPGWIQQELSKRDFLFGKGILIVNNFNYKEIFTIIENLCKRITGETWEELATKLNHYFNWEFEDYTE